LVAGDLRSLVEAVQRRGVHVTVVSTLSMIADALAPSRCLHRLSGIEVEDRPPSSARAAPGMMKSISSIGQQRWLDRHRP